MSQGRDGVEMPLIADSVRVAVTSESNVAEVRSWSGNFLLTCSNVWTAANQNPGRAALALLGMGIPMLIAAVFMGHEASESVTRPSQALVFNATNDNPRPDTAIWTAATFAYSYGAVLAGLLGAACVSTACVTALPVVCRSRDDQVSHGPAG